MPRAHVSVTIVTRILDLVVPHLRGLNWIHVARCPRGDVLAVVVLLAMVVMHATLRDHLVHSKLSVLCAGVIPSEWFCPVLLAEFIRQGK